MTKITAPSPLMEHRVRALKAWLSAEDPKNMPKGMALMPDQGLQRRVWHDAANNWVLKVDRQSWTGANLTEYRAYTRCVDRVSTHPTMRIPPTWLIDEIIVMDFIEGTNPSCEDWDDDEAERVTGVVDLHFGNVIFDGIFHWIIDLGYGDSWSGQCGTSEDEDGSW